MLSKIIIILLSLLLVIVSLAFLGSVENINIQTAFIPDLNKLNFSELPVIIVLATALILMVLGILFSSIESSSKVNRLLNFLKNGMPENDLKKLDRVSKSIAEYIRGIGSEPVAATVSENPVVNNDNNSEKNETSESSEAPVKEEPEPLPFEQEKETEATSKETIEDFQPDLPNPDEFDGEDKKTIVASSFSLEGLGSLKTKVEDEEDFAPTNFSDFADDDDDSKDSETVIASVPEELLKQTQTFMENTREQELKSVYNKFYEMKVELGESTSSLTEAAFIKKLKDTEKKLITTNNCKKVEFMVYNKNGKAALKATPKY